MAICREVLSLSLLYLFAGVGGASPDSYEPLYGRISPGTHDDPDYWVHIYAPQSNKSFPTIFFVSGFGANAPVFGYSDLLTSIATRGYIIVGVDRLSVPNYPKEAKQFMDVMTWAKAGNLKAEMAKKKLAATPDLNRATVMAQSAGNHIVGQALADSCMYAKAFVMIDPVDGFDPFGLVHTEDLIHPGKKLNFSIPALILDNGLDPKGVRAFKNVSCMPIKLGSPRWYNAWRGPIWHVNATAYGHIDCLNDALQVVAGLVCPSNPKTDKSLYREHLAATSTLFIEALLDRKPDMLALLEEKSHFNVDVVLEHDRKGLKDIEPSCTNVPSHFKEIVV
jgi:hypothetical protein